MRDGSSRSRAWLPSRARARAREEARPRFPGCRRAVAVPKNGSLPASLVLVAALAACGGPSAPPIPKPDPAAEATGVARPEDVARLEKLFGERRREGEPGNYRIGPGDELSLSVYRVDELQGLYTVGRDGRLLLPMVGTVVAEGLTETALADEIARRLEERFLDDPVVRVSVTKFQGSRVAVMGGAARPGFYAIESDRETILDILNRAGGLRASSVTRLHFTPAGQAPSAGLVASADRAIEDAHEPRDSDTATDAAPAPVAAAATDPARATDDADDAAADEDAHDAAAGAARAPAADPIEIDLTNLQRGGRVRALGLPVRGGDVLYLEDAGQVIVGGWVKEPGSYELRPGMTLAQAVTRAGGLHFGASPSEVTLSRKPREGRRAESTYDYDEVVGGGADDVRLQAGDRIEVGSNPAKVAVWSVYSFVSAIVSFGVGATVGF